MITGVIPSRWGSSRFPGKPLADILGKPMIMWVWEAACKSKLLNRVVIATDDERIYKACIKFGAEVIMTKPSHPSGSDRVAEAARTIEGNIFVNIQGDEPLLSPDNIDAALKPFIDDPAILMGTLKRKIVSAEELFNVNIVKVVTDKKDFAIYFSRLPIPFERSEGIKSIDYHSVFSAAPGLLETRYAQIGLYVFRRDFLFKFTSMEPSPLEKAEKLEQLRALENGYKIKVVRVEKSSPGVDSPEDLDKIINHFAESSYEN